MEYENTGELLSILQNPAQLGFPQGRFFCLFVYAFFWAPKAQCTFDITYIYQALLIT